jgi:hypothetical protein
MKTTITSVAAKTENRKPLPFIERLNMAYTGTKAMGNHQRQNQGFTHLNTNKLPRPSPAGYVASTRQQQLHSLDY